MKAALLLILIVGAFWACHAIFLTIKYARIAAIPTKGPTP